MPKLRYILLLLFVVCVSIATSLPPPPRALASEQGQSAGILVAVLGDARRLFANDLFAKADAYFHRGNYPSIFDSNPRREENHMVRASSGSDTEPPEEHDGHDPDGEHVEDDGPPPRDFLEEFGRNFHPTLHVHLREGEEREMLPWLQLSAEMDPHQVASFTVAAYWLRTRLGKVDDAEQFLREGLRKNPGNPELLHELGRLYFENRNDLTRARNILKYALRQWHEREDLKKEPDLFLQQEILGGLAQVELAAKDYQAAIGYFRQIKALSSKPEEVQARIDELELRSREAR